MSIFDNVEVYVRITDHGYEGESLRFATVNEEQALTYFSDGKSGEEYAPKYNGEELRVFVGGKHIKTWHLRDGKWMSEEFKQGVEYGTVVVEES